MARQRARHEGSGETVTRIASELEETEPVAVSQIKRIVQTLGEDRALSLLQQALIPRLKAAMTRLGVKPPNGL